MKKIKCERGCKCFSYSPKDAHIPCESEELKKEWEREFDEKFEAWIDGQPLSIFKDLDCFPKVKSFISSLLAKQQEFIDITAEENYLKGREDAMEEFVKCIPEEKDNRDDNAEDYGYNQCIADIKSKLLSSSEGEIK